MNLSIAFISDAGVRFPPGSLRDPIIAEMKEMLVDLIFSEFGNLSIYMHLNGRGSINTFGPPGITLELNQREDELIVKCVVDGDEYMALTGTNWTPKLNAIVDGTIASVVTVLQEYNRSDEIAIYEELLLETKLRD